MNRIIQYIVIVALTSVSLFLTACENTVEKDMIQPVEMMVGQKSKAALQAAFSNVQNVRAALMRYPANSSSGEFPRETDIYDYKTLRQTLAGAGLPEDVAQLMWDPAYGISYRSAGTSFTFEVRTFSGERIVATPGGWK